MINPGRVLIEWKTGGDITALAVLPGGEAVLAGRADSKVIVLNVSDGKVQKEIDHGAPISELRVRADGKQIVTLGGPTAKLWETDKWAMTAQLQGNPTAAESVARLETDPGRLQWKAPVRELRQILGVVDGKVITSATGRMVALRLDDGRAVYPIDNAF